MSVSAVVVDTELTHSGTVAAGSIRTIRVGPVKPMGPVETRDVFVYDPDFTRVG